MEPTQLILGTEQTPTSNRKKTWNVSIREKSKLGPTFRTPHLFVRQKLCPRPEDGPRARAAVARVLADAHVDQQKGRQVLLAVEEEEPLRERIA